MNEGNTAKNSELIAAILQVMEEVKGIDKTKTIGEGKNAYKGVSDQDVKQIIGAAMQKAGLTIITTEITPKVTIKQWTETYNGNVQTKYSHFTEVTTKYLLLHKSGESQVLSGYGHGVDTQDKAAGKATTYALKYALLYLFLVPTGSIDDADATHSEKLPAPPSVPADTRVQIGKKAFDQLIERINGGDAAAYDKAIKAFKFTDEERSDLEVTYQNKFPKKV